MSPTASDGGTAGEGQAAIVWSTSEPSSTYRGGGPCPGGGLDCERHRLITAKAGSRHSPGYRRVPNRSTVLGVAMVANRSNNTIGP